MTIKMWFQYLPADVRQKAIANTEAERLNAEFGCLSEAIDKAFNWNESKEGFDYWDKIFMAMLDAPEPRPDLAMPELHCPDTDWYDDSCDIGMGIHGGGGNYRRCNDDSFEPEYDR